MTTTDRHGRKPNSGDEGRDHVWIVSRFDTVCVECNEDLPAGSHILWLPKAPRDENNYCASCGEEIAGSYPPQHYWERRDANFREQQEAGQ